MPINQITMQFNSIISALAGAERIFHLLDEKPEQDNGYVKLVNVKPVHEEQKERRESERRENPGMAGKEKSHPVDSGNAGSVMKSEEQGGLVETASHMFLFAET